MAKPADAREI